MANICYNYLKFKGNKNEMLDLYGKINGVCDVVFKDTFPQLKEFELEDGPDWSSNCGTDDLQLDGESGSFGWSLETNWAPPMDGMRYLSVLYPGLEMRLTYTEEGMDFCGRHDFLAGAMISDYEGNCLYDWDVLDFVADVHTEKIIDPATILDTAVKVFRDWDGMTFNCDDLEDWNDLDECYDTVLDAYCDQGGQTTMANDVHALSEVIVIAANEIGLRHLPDEDFDSLRECLELLRCFADEVGGNSLAILAIWEELELGREIIVPDHSGDACGHASAVVL